MKCGKAMAFMAASLLALGGVLPGLALPASAAGGPVTVDLTAFMNNDGISNDGDPLDGDLDGAFLGLPSEELPAAGSLVQFGETVFAFPAKDDGLKNNLFAYGQTLPMPSSQAHYSAAYLLIASVGGAQTVRITARYADGTSADADLKVADIGGAPGMKKFRVLATTHRHNSSGDAVPGLNLWGLSIPLDGARALESLSLDEKPEVHIFALTLSATE